jgi:hypothetical protein
MKRSALAALAVIAVFAAVAAAASSRAPTVAVPHAVKAPQKGEGSLLAVVPGARGPVLGRADRRALWVARRSPRLRIFNSVAAWAYAPDRSVLALATQPQQGLDNPPATLQFVQPAVVRRLARTVVGEGRIRALAFGDGRINLVLEHSCCPSAVEIVGVDVGTIRVVSRRTLPNAVVSAQRAGDSIVLLLAPERGIGTAALAVVDPGGTVRTVALSQITAGIDLPTEETTDFSKLHRDYPGLAVAPDASVAFVVPATGAIARVSLADLAVSYHSVVQPVSLLGRLHDWVEPKAEAKGISGPERSARWLGAGVIAVSGGDEAVSVDSSNQMHVSWKPAGLTLIDTNTWGARLIDRGADSVTVDGDTLLATGSTWTTEGNDDAMGLAAYGFDGSRRFAVLHGRSAVVALVFRRRAYVGVGDRYRTKVVDLTNGAMLKDRHAPLAQLLIGDGSS